MRVLKSPIFVILLSPLLAYGMIWLVAWADIDPMPGLLLVAVPVFALAIGLGRLANRTAGRIVATAFAGIGFSVVVLGVLFVWALSNADLN